VRRLLVLTRIWPTAERPSLGSFVRDRVSGLEDVVVVRPRSQATPWPMLYLRMLWDALRARRISGVEAHVLVPTALVGWLVGRLRGIPVVAYAHGGDVRDWPRQRWHRRAATRFVARHVDRVVTNSEESARWLRTLGADPVVAPPGIDLRQFGPAPRPATRRVLYLGGRNPRKGFDVAQELADTMVGPWLREVDRDEVRALLHEHDVVLVPSVDEPFGLVAVEAIASGRWVVAAAVGGLRDIVIDGTNGTLVADGDFAAALERVPDYDPYAIAPTVARFSLEAWQSALAVIWDTLAPEAPPG
jgi:glycosyltransferase involved in cell wall biosynthesis